MGMAFLPYAGPVFERFILQLDLERKIEFISASNNAAWSVGEVAMRYGRG